DLLHLVAVDLQDEGLAVGEVPVERALADAGLLGDGAERCVRTLCQLVQGDAEDAFTVALRVRAQRGVLLVPHSSLLKSSGRIASSISGKLSVTFAGSRR